MTHGEPPKSIEAEQGVLGSILMSSSVIDQCVKVIAPDYFFIPAHETIYRALLERWNKGEVIDLITLTQELRDRGQLETVGGASFVTSLYTFVPTAANVDYYLDIVREKYLRRQLIVVSTEAVRRAYADQGEAGELLSEHRGHLDDLTNLRASQERETLSDQVRAKMERMEHGDRTAVMVPTGIAKLDEASPLFISDMPLVSGERKAGKTILATSIMTNVAQSGIPVAMFSLEDSSAKTIDRLLSGISKVPMNKQYNIKNLTPEEMSASTKAATALSNLPLYLYDDLYDLHHIIAESRQLYAQKQIGLIVVDYAQLIRTAERKDRNREQEVALISRSLRLLSLDLNVPIMLLSQLNEQGRSRESRSLEQDATASWKIGLNPDKPLEPNVRWIDIQWQRNGESNVQFPITFLGHCARVENYQQETP